MFCWEGDLFEIFDHHAIGETDNSNLDLTPLNESKF